MKNRREKREKREEATRKREEIIGEEKERRGDESDKVDIWWRKSEMMNFKKKERVRELLQREKHSRHYYSCQ